MLRTNIGESKSEWNENLKHISMAHNTTVHSTTGFTPFELTFGREANMPSEMALTPKLTQKRALQTLERQTHRIHNRCGRNNERK